MINRFLRTVRRFLSVHRGEPSPDAGGSRQRGEPVFALQHGRFSLAQGLIRGFYAFGLYLSVSHLVEFGGKLSPERDLLLWPVMWLAWLPGHARLGSDLILLMFLGGQLLGAVLTGWRAARIVAFVSWLEYVALLNSASKIGHTLHLFVILSFLLIFLPTGWEMTAVRAGRAIRQRTLLVFWGCQAMVMLTYTMAGISKVIASFYQLATHQANAFSPDALALHVAERLRETNSVSLVGSWLIQHPAAGWPALPATIYLQSVAFCIAFRPSLHRVWAAGLIGFHLASFFTMTINFPQNCFLLALLFFCSPFAPAADCRQMLADLPLIGAAGRCVMTWKKRGRPSLAVSPASNRCLTSGGIARYS